MKTAIQLIADERERQISKEGWTSKHDDQYFNNELAIAGSLYAQPEDIRDYSEYGDFPNNWPWDGKDWKPTPNDRIRELVKAAALIVADIERLQREKP